MTLQELFDLIGSNPTLILIYFTLLPITALVAGFMSKDEGYQEPWCYLYSVLVYAACIPGIFALTLTGYSFMFERSSMLDKNIFVYFLPILVMIATLLLINRNVDIQDIPGFGRLTGLLLAIFAVFVVMFLLQRMRIFTVFFGSVTHLFGLFIVLLAAFMWGSSKLFKGSGDNRKSKRDTSRELDF